MANKNKNKSRSEMRSLRIRQVIFVIISLMIVAAMILSMISK